MNKQNTYQLNLEDIQNSSPAYIASIFSLGNGHFGVRASDQLINNGTGGTIINGFYEESPIVYGEEAHGYPKNNQSIILLPDLRHISISYNHQSFTDSKIEKMQLDMQLGELNSKYLLSDPMGNQISLEVSTIISQTVQSFFLVKYKLTPLNFSGTLSINKTFSMPSKETMGHDPRKGKGSFNLIEKAISQKTDQLIEEFQSRQSRLTIQIALKTLDSNLSLENQQLIVTQNHLTEINYLFAISEINHEIDPTVLSVSPNMILQDAKNYWLNFWHDSDVQIADHNRLELGIHYNIFQLNQGAGRDGKSNIPAKGLSGIGYDGHYFWDTEMYMLPFFIFTNPNEAKQLLAYRYSILPEAKKRAKELGVKQGALFAWRTINGKEASAFFPAGTAQYHIDADIAYTIGLYYDATKDIHFISDMGLSIVLETARFWKSFGSWQTVQGQRQFVFNDVTGPDEYTAIVNNNYFTNRMAKNNLQLAVRLAHELQESTDSNLPPLTVNPTELKSFTEIADKIYLPYNAEKQIIAQDDSFFQKPIWPFETTPKENYPLLLHYHPLTIYRYQVSKQPDALNGRYAFPR